MKSLQFPSAHTHTHARARTSPFSTFMYLTVWVHWLTVCSVCNADAINNNLRFFCFGYKFITEYSTLFYY